MLVLKGRTVFTGQSGHRTNGRGGDTEREAGWGPAVHNREEENTGGGLDLGRTTGRLGLFLGPHGNKVWTGFWP